MYFFYYSQLERDLIRECPYLIPAVDILDLVLFPKEFDNNQIFNDLSIQTFPKHKLEKLSDDFWSTSVPERNEEEKTDRE
jgi:hypothetical protein